MADYGAVKSGEKYMMNRQDIKPSDQQLQPYIEKFIVLTGNRNKVVGGDVVRIFPRAGPSLYINFACYFSKENLWMKSGMSGIHDQFYFLEHASGSTIDEIIIQFSSFGLSMFSEVNVHELKNNLIDPYGVFGSGSSHLYEQLGNSAPKQRIDIIENAFKKFIRDIKVEDQVIHKIAGAIMRDQVLPSPVDIERLSNLSFRQIERKFQRLIGVNMRLFNKIVRFEKSMSSMAAEESNKLLTETAYEYNYYDQAHFIREFKELSGLTPKEFRAELTSL